MKSFTPRAIIDSKQNVFNNGCEDNDIAVIITAVYYEGDVKVTKEFYYTTPMIQSAMSNNALTASIPGCDAFTGLE